MWDERDQWTGGSVLWEAVVGVVGVWRRRRGGGGGGGRRDQIQTGVGGGWSEAVAGVGALGL
jgi:hypothetical protein